jgi:hypothetical protein
MLVVAPEVAYVPTWQAFLDAGETLLLGICSFGNKAMITENDADMGEGMGIRLCYRNPNMLERRYDSIGISNFNTIFGV